MKLQPLYDLQQEINRLFIAGSKFAKADPRISKQVTVFEKLGEKAPVFKKIAVELQELLQTEPNSSAEKLMSVSTLLYAVLYTQGEATEDAGATGNLNPSFSIETVNTNNSYLQLKPVIEALTTSSPGRLEILKEAMAQGLFADFRTYQYLNIGLADKYSELADYIIGNIIPAIGQPILPFIENAFAYEDKTEQVRRLKALDVLGYKNINTITEKILSENLPALQAEAINILSRDPSKEALILKLADDKNKLVRESAYYALAHYNTRESQEKLKDIYLKGKDMPGVIGAIAQTPFTWFFDEILEQYNKAFQNLSALPKDATDKDVAAAFRTVEEGLPLFKNKDRQEVYQLIEKIFLDKDFNQLLKDKKNLLSYSIPNLATSIIQVLHSFDPANRLNFYKQLLPKTQYSHWLEPLYSQYFQYCISAGFGKEKLYDIFMEPFKKGYIDIQDLYKFVFKHNVPDLEIIDSRWIRYLLQQINSVQKLNYNLRNYLMILHVYEPANSKQLNNELIHLVRTFPLNEVDYVFELMLERNVSGSFELIYHSLRDFKRKSSYYHSYIGKKEYWKSFPKEYAAKIRALYDKEKLELFNEIADTIEYQ